MHLHLHSWYSFLAGTLSVDRIIAHGREQGARALALTDVNNVSGITEFYSKARAAGIKPIIGVELRAGRSMAVALAKDRQGYREICEAVTALAVHCPPARIAVNDRLPPVQPEEGEGLGTANLLAEIIPEHLSDHVILLSRDADLLGRLSASGAAPSLFVELIKSDEASWPGLLGFAESHGISLVATNDVYFGEPGGHKLHGILRAISTNKTLGTLDRTELAHPSAFFIGEQQFREWFRGIPEALTNREKIADRCNVDFDFESSKFTGYDDIDAPDRIAKLRSLAEEGLLRRYPATVSSGTTEARARLEKELRIISELGFVDYFLVAWDVVRYAKRKNYPYVGRGSGANSIVAYCLEITNVDPIELDLFFERFLNPERKSPPDFDIDFSWRNRDDVIDYVLEKYGPERTAMIGTISTFNPRGALREVGKVLGFGAAEIREVTSMLPGFSGVKDFQEPTSPFRRQARSLLESKYGNDWARTAMTLLGFPNHYGIHSGGVILAPEAMTHYTATQISPKGVRITQQDMYSLEEWRLEKLDILSTRGLGTFEDTMLEVRRRTGRMPPILDFKNACRDEKTRTIMREGRTVGCFYVESPAMIQLLKKLRTDTFEMLTAASSIIRPGVAQSGMMQSFIERFHDPSRIDPPHPAMAELLKRTFGVMVYQEDVIKVAHFIGKLSLGEADLLRRAMSGKMRSREAMSALKETFFSGCRGQGIEPQVISEIWRQMESFAGYSFCKAHSASYAVLSFQEAWLKAHHPAIFLCSVLNNQGGYYRPEVYIQEAKRLGIRILLPDVNKSGELHSCEDDKTIQLGFLHVKGFSSKSRDRLITERETNGRYDEFGDFLVRSGITYEDVRTLIRCGACDGFGGKRGAMLVRGKLAFNRKRKEALEPELPLGFHSFEQDLQGLRSYTPEQVTQIELETFSYTVSTHVLTHFSEQLRGTVKAADLGDHVGRRVRIGGWLISAKLTRTRKGDRMMFVNLDDSTGMIDVVLFPKCFDAFAHLMRSTGPFIVTGRVAKEYDVVNLVAERVERIQSE